ncbi:MAG: hemolysin family protein [Tepidisphaeraceae bacterium]
MIALNAFFVVSEYAVVAIRPAQLAALQSRGRQRAASAMTALQAAPASAIGAIQVCITMTNLLLGYIGEPAMSQVLYMAMGPLIDWWPTLFNSISFVLSFIVVTFLTVVFSELLPKAMTLRYVTMATRATAVPTFAIQRAIYPLVWLMNATANAVTKPLGLGSVESLEQQEVTADELRLLAMQAGEQGVVSERERSLIVNSLSIGRKMAKEIMVPRVRVACVDLKLSMEENRQVAERRLFSRMPLCDGGLDNLVGVVRIKEFLEAYYAHGETAVLSLIAQPPIFLPESIPLDRLIEAFHDRRTQMVFLVDEYGGVEGLVTLRDVIDELFRKGNEAKATERVAPGPRNTV